MKIKNDIKCLLPKRNKLLYLLKYYWARNIPHKCKNKIDWCLPIWYISIFGGYGDTGNGYCWYPNRFKKYE